MRNLTILAALLALAACTSPDSARQALEGAGYSNVKLHGYSLTGCSESDQYHDNFTATGPTGRPVSGVVCSGWLKGSTIRFD